MVDLNFDGYTDLRIVSDWATTMTWYACYLWNPRIDRFEISEALCRLPFVNVNREKQVITSMEPAGAGHTTGTEFRWRDGLLEVREIRKSDTSFILPQLTTVSTLRFDDNGKIIFSETACQWDEAHDPWAVPGRAASRFTPPAPPSHPDLERLMELATLSPEFDSPEQLKTAYTRSLLFSLAYEREHSGEGPAKGNDEKLPEEIRSCKQAFPRSWFVRYKDMEDAGKRLFGSGFRLEKPDGENEWPLSGEYYFSPDPPAVSWNALNVVKEFPLSLEQNGDQLQLTSMRFFIYGGRIAASGFPGSPIGYVDDNGVLYFYDDVDLNTLERRTCTFQKEDGRCIIRSCQTRPAEPGQTDARKNPLMWQTRGSEIHGFP